jgi:hypothetical protein
MQAADRDEFEIQLAKLCAGFNVPMTSHRKDAYWSGLAKLSLPQFARCVDYALTDDGPDDLPSTKGIWKIFRALRSGHTFEQQRQVRPLEPDHIEYWANRLLYAHIASRGGLGTPGSSASPELTTVLKAKRELVDWFAGPIRDGDTDATPAEFLRQWIAALQEIGHVDKALNSRWCEMIERPEYSQPFPPSMGRELQRAPQQQSLVAA